MLTDFFTWPKAVRTYLAGFIFIFYLAKFMIIPFLFVDDIIRLGKWIGSKFSQTEPVAPNDPGITRSQFISQLALIFAAIPFFALIYGIVYGGTDYKVRRRKLRFPNLPQAFHGLKILQISDIHSGSFLNTDPLERAVRMINGEKADVIFFTGDLVNNRTDEVLPFMDTLRGIQAPMGVFSSLGNHDYGDYMQWDSKEQKAANLQHLFDVHKSLGWNLLRNENRILERNGERIAIAGCENWSASNRFPKYGNLPKTTTGLGQVPFTILMSHDPSHWDAQVLDHAHKIDLMLAGHTHGMQFGIDTKWLKWSPSQYFYRQWAGLYKKDDKYLYVNRGLGFLGYPGRAGIRPEITVIELLKA